MPKEKHLAIWAKHYRQNIKSKLKGDTPQLYIDVSSLLISQETFTGTVLCENHNKGKLSCIWGIKWILPLLCCIEPAVKLNHMMIGYILLSKLILLLNLLKILIFYWFLLRKLGDWQLFLPEVWVISWGSNNFTLHEAGEKIRTDSAEVNSWSNWDPLVCVIILISS